MTQNNGKTYSFNVRECPCGYQMHELLSMYFGWGEDVCPQCGKVRIIDFESKTITRELVRAAKSEAK